MDLKFNHMELTIPKGHLTDEWIADFDAFYGDVFGWSGKRWRSLGGCLVTAFCVRYLLPIDFDVMHQAPKVT